MNTTPAERRERYKTALRNVRMLRDGKNQDRQADAVIAVADQEIDAAKFQAGEQWAKEYAEAARLRKEAAEVRAAVISDCDRYRYELTRRWADGPVATFVMLNPSTADGDQDDPTIRRCTGYATAWGCGGLHVVNLYALRATSPADLWAADDPVGPENDAWLMCAAITGGPLVAAWGAHARPDRIAAVLELPGFHSLEALATTKAGQPRHPLYLPAGLTPQPWINPDDTTGA